MMLDDLIEKLYKLKREYGDREVQLFTQDRNRGWDDHDIDEVYFNDELYFCEDGKIVIQAKENKWCEE